MLMQNGGPSQMELFDPKPELNRREGEVYATRVEMFQTGSEANKLLGCPFKFHRRGQCGMELSEIIPHLGTIADDACLVRSMHSEPQQPHRSAGDDEHRQDFSRPAVARLVGQLWPGHREPELAGLHRAARSRGLQHQRHAAVAERLDSGPVSRHRSEHARARRCSTCSRPRRPAPRLAATISTFWPGSTRSIASAIRARAELDARIRNYELAARMQLADRRDARSGETKRPPRKSCTASTTPRRRATARGC